MSETALATVPVVTHAQRALITRTIAQGATPEELDLFFYDCQRHGVHPLDKLIHFTKRKGKYTPITSIDLMRSRAADTGEMAGSDDPEFYEPSADAKHPEWAKVTVYRMTGGQRFPYTATARWSEYYPGDGEPGFMWRKMPHTMLGKCAEALALRKAFPKQLSGLYAREEMQQAEVAEIVPPRASQTTTGPRVTGDEGKPDRVTPPTTDAELYQAFPPDIGQVAVDARDLFAKDIRDCPMCVKKEPPVLRTLRKGAKQWGGGVYCNKKDGGCGYNWRADWQPEGELQAQPSVQAEVEPSVRHGSVASGGEGRTDAPFPREQTIALLKRTCGVLRLDTRELQSLRKTHTNGKMLDDATDEELQNLEGFLGDGEAVSQWRAELARGAA